MHEQVLTQIREHIHAPLLPLPDVQRGRRKRPIIPDELCRRSARLQQNAKSLPSSYIKRAQRVLMSKMGICEIEDEPQVDCLQKYAQLFRSPLPQHRIDALARLFSLDVPL